MATFDPVVPSPLGVLEFGQIRRKAYAQWLQRFVGHHVWMAIPNPVFGEEDDREYLGMAGMLKEVRLLESRVDCILEEDRMYIDADTPGFQIRAFDKNRPWEFQGMTQEEYESALNERTAEEWTAWSKTT